MGHTGKESCTKCFKVFPTQQFGDYLVYSGFISEWEPQSHALHVWYAKEQKKAKKKRNRE